MKKNTLITLCLTVIGVFYVMLLSPQTQATAAPNATAITVTCTNNNNDANTINSAINSSPDGAEIVITGECLINQPIRLRGNRSYRGESRSGTILQQANGTSFDAILASDSYLDNLGWTGAPVSVRHLKVRGTGSGETSGLIIRSWLTTIEDVWVDNMGGDGIRLTNRGINGAALTNTQVNGRISASFINNSGNHGIHVQDDQNQVTDWILSDNWIAQSDKDGIHIDNAAGWMIERNHIYNVGQHAIRADRMFGTTISNNYVEGFGESSINPPWGMWYGIYGSVQGSDVGSTIFGNRVFNFGGEPNGSARYHYIGLGMNYGTGSVSVTGNTLVGAGSSRSTGLDYYAKPNTYMEVASTGNTIRKIDTPRFEGSRVTITSGY